MAPTPEIPVDTQAAAAAVQVSPATIRSWANRGHLVRLGTDHKGRTTYNLQDVMDASARGKIVQIS